jgi:hypothetical protein
MKVDGDIDNLSARETAKDRLAPAGSARGGMVYREVTMIEVKEVLRLWRAGTPKKRMAAILGLHPMTVRHYIKTTGEAGVSPLSAREPVTDDELTAVLLALHPARERPHGESWAACEAAWKHIAIPYPTLHRLAVAELGFGRTARTIAVADRELGAEMLAVLKTAVRGTVPGVRIPLPPPAFAALRAASARQVSLRRPSGGFAWASQTRSSAQAKAVSLKRR